MAVPITVLAVLPVARVTSFYFHRFIKGTCISKAFADKLTLTMIDVIPLTFVVIRIFDTPTRRSLSAGILTFFFDRRSRLVIMASIIVPIITCSFTIFLIVVITRVINGCATRTGRLRGRSSRVCLALDDKHSFTPPTLINMLCPVGKTDAYQHPTH